MKLWVDVEATPARGLARCGWIFKFKENTIQNFVLPTLRKELRDRCFPAFRKVHKGLV